MWILQVLFFLPETKEKTLEELDAVFNVPLRVHAKYGRKWLQKQTCPSMSDSETWLLVWRIEHLGSLNPPPLPPEPYPYPPNPPDPTTSFTGGAICDSVAN